MVIARSALRSRWSSLWSRGDRVNVNQIGVRERAVARLIRIPPLYPFSIHGTTSLAEREELNSTTLNYHRPMCDARACFGL